MFALLMIISPLYIYNQILLCLYNGTVFLYPIEVAKHIQTHAAVMLTLSVMPNFCHCKTSSFSNKYDYLTIDESLR